MNDFDKDRFKSEILREVCRRIGHEWSEWRTLNLWDGSGTYQMRSCKSCGRDEAPRITSPFPNGAEVNDGR